MVTPDDVDDCELLDKVFGEGDLQDGKIHYSLFRSEEVSVYRDLYRPWTEILKDEEFTKKHGDGIAQLRTSYVRATPPAKGTSAAEGGLDVVKSEPPPAHAHIARHDKKSTTKGQARRLAEQATLQIVRMPGAPK